MKRTRPALYRVRRSAVHGLGVFAAAASARARASWNIWASAFPTAKRTGATKRKSRQDSHTFLFVVDRSVVNRCRRQRQRGAFHQSRLQSKLRVGHDERRVFVEAIRTIRPGEELSYDYAISRDQDDPPDIDTVFACRCSAESCRGTMLKPAARPRKPVRAARQARS